MALSPKLEFRQTQSLVMTPQLMQAIKLLQLSNLDLVAFVEAEIERNPLLEREDDAPDVVDSVSGPNDSAYDRPNGDGGDRHGTADGFASHDFEAGEFADSTALGADGRAEEGGETASAAHGLDRDLNIVPGLEASDGAGLDLPLGDLFPDDVPLVPAFEPNLDGLDPSRLAGDAWTSTGSGGGEAGLEAFATVESTLRDHLSQQLTLAIPDPARRLIGQVLIDAIDEAGYLRADPAQVAEQLGTGLDDVTAVLATIQSFDPTGVGARTLAECLALQLIERDRFDPAMRTLVDHLDLVARQDRAQLRRLCKVDDDDLAGMLAELRALDPKPGLAFAPSDAVQTVVPDVLVRPTADGGFRIELNSDTLPRVLVNRTYYSAIVRSSQDPAERTYLSDCLQTANWLVKSLDQRAKTVLKVATEIVRQQDAFFRKGVAFLRPLNLKIVADEIGMHESTVSRVTANKYMATTRGIFELKYFFTSAIASADGGDAHSAEAVRHHIRQMIDAEDPSAVLSDDTIVQRLRDAGIDIARRTVAKYRESMRIPSSVDRRREKRATARSA